jgi:hypothetical protein
MRCYVGLLICALTMVGCSRSDRSRATPAAQSAGATVGNYPTHQPTTPARASDGVDSINGKVDACALLTSKEIQLIQSETLKETRASDRSEGGFAISQCLYSMPTATNSINLLVARRGDPPAARDPRGFWNETFHREELAREQAEARDGSRAGDAGKNKMFGRDEAELRAGAPQRIAGLGDDAYWIGNRVGGALYALSGNTYVRISVDSPGDQSVNIRKCKALAQIILKRL